MPRFRPLLAAAALAVGVAVGPWPSLAHGAAPAALPSANPAGQQQLSNERTETRWAYAADTRPVYSRPSGRARPVTRLRLLTEDDFPNVYLVLTRWVDPGGTVAISFTTTATTTGTKTWTTSAYGNTDCVSSPYPAPDLQPTVDVTAYETDPVTSLRARSESGVPGASARRHDRL